MENGLNWNQPVLLENSSSPNNIENKCKIISYKLKLFHMKAEMKKKKKCLTAYSFCSYSFVPYCASWNLSEKKYPITHGKEINHTIIRICTEYSN